MATTILDNNPPRTELWWRMLLAYGLTFITYFFIVGLSSISLGIGLLVVFLPIGFVFGFFLLPIGILTLCIKLCTKSIPLKYSVYIASISVIIFWLVFRTVLAAVNDTGFIPFIPITIGFAAAYCTGLLLEYYLSKSKRNIAMMIMLGLMIAVAGVLYWFSQYSEPPSQAHLKDAADAAKVAADLPKHRDEVIDPNLVISPEMVPIFSPETKITLQQETWKSNGTDKFNAYRGNAYAIVEPPGKRMLIKFERHDDKWYIHEVSNKPQP